jgi:hypothetical protein
MCETFVVRARQVEGAGLALTGSARNRRRSVWIAAEDLRSHSRPRIRRPSPRRTDVMNDSGLSRHSHSVERGMYVGSTALRWGPLNGCNLNVADIFMKMTRILLWPLHRWVWLDTARLAALLRWLIPYRSSAAVEQGITRTRDSLCALVDLARARGALPLIVVPQFGPESATEKILRRILDETELPYVHVKLDPSWHLPGDLHPDPRAAQAIAIAVAGRLHGRYADGKPPGRAYSR